MVLQVLRILIHSFIHIVWIENLNCLLEMRQLAWIRRKQLPHSTAKSLWARRKEMVCSIFLVGARVEGSHTKHKEAPLQHWTDFLVRIY